MTRLAVFDCDGTLVDSGATIGVALRAALERNGYPVPPPAVSRRVIGLSLTEAMAALLPNAGTAEHVRLADDYRQVFMTLRANGGLRSPCSTA